MIVSSKGKAGAAVAMPDGISIHRTVEVHHVRCYVTLEREEKWL
jgi:hypothetical protein